MKSPYERPSTLSTGSRLIRVDSGSPVLGRLQGQGQGQSFNHFNHVFNHFFLLRGLNPMIGMSVAVVI
jgi:hypothetical protein